LIHSVRNHLRRLLVDDPTGSDILTPREREVLALATHGHTNDEIADALGVTRNAVRYHLKEIHSKLDTGGDRSLLARLRALLPFAAAAGGASKLASGLSFAGVAALLGVMAAGVVLAYPDSSATSAAEQDDLGRSAIRRERDANGCPRLYSAGNMTLRDFAIAFRTTLDEMRALNPHLPDGPLPPDTEVRVPNTLDGECAEAVPTPAP
jgi:DNA-binding CsgD family transcriptional regulator